MSAKAALPSWARRRNSPGIDLRTPPVCLPPSFLPSLLSSFLPLPLPLCLSLPFLVFYTQGRSCLGRVESSSFSNKWGCAKLWGCLPPALPVKLPFKGGLCVRTHGRGASRLMVRGQSPVSTGGRVRSVGEGPPASGSCAVSSPATCTRPWVLGRLPSSPPPPAPSSPRWGGGRSRLNTRSSAHRPSARTAVDAGALRCGLRPLHVKSVAGHRASLRTSVCAGSARGSGRSVSK